jgi:beta-glucosidase-like glycosyl hydrolase
MPGPTRWRGKLLSHAITHGKVDSATLDARAREMLELINKCSRANISREAVEGGVDTPETARLLRKLAADSIVLLKNEKSLLPLKPTEKARTLILTYRKHTMLTLSEDCHNWLPCEDSYILWRRIFVFGSVLYNQPLRWIF